MAPRTWFITGANRGLGRAITNAVLEIGDSVVATARSPKELVSDLVGYGDRAIVLPLDVNDSVAVSSTVSAAIEQAGQIDIVVNNAGYGLAGGIEEVTEAQARAQFDTNFFGALWVTKALLPHLRQRGSGHIVQISSGAGLVALPNLGIYCASKWALEAMSEALAAEVAPFGIAVTLVEPSGLRTDWAGSSMERADELEDYDDVLSARRSFLNASNPATQVGDPVLAAHAIVEAVASTSPPLRLLLGGAAVRLVNSTYRKRLEGMAEWETLAHSIDTA